MDILKEIKVSIKMIVKDRQGRCLLIKRSAASKANAHKWDFPGGKEDPGESFTESIAREVKEETGLQVSIINPIGVAQSDAPEKRIFYIFVEGFFKKGKVILSSEHEEYRWVSSEEMLKMDFCPQFKEFVKQYVEKKGGCPKPDVDRTSAKFIEEQTRLFVERISQYDQYAIILKSVLGQIAQKYSPLSIVQVRRKTIAGFAEKIHRKGGKYKDPLNEITDLCGGRIITQTVSEIKPICDYIEKHFEIDWKNSIDVSQRHKPAEFGYRSVHYIIQLKPGEFPNGDIQGAIPKNVYKLKAEVQVRTLLEHAWAGFTHDMSYKNAFKIPVKWERQLAAAAATLESVDASFIHIQTGLLDYGADYGAYKTEQQIRDDIRKLKIILKFDKRNLSVAQRIGKLAITLGDWKTAISTLKKYVSTKNQPILRDLGVALCKDNKKRSNSAEYRKGQRYLLQATQLNPYDADAFASLAGTWKGKDEKKAREYYGRAFQIDPSNPYPLGNYLECELPGHKDIRLISLIRPVIERAIQRCHSQIEVNMNIPWAYYDVGKFNFLLGDTKNSILFYAKAIQSSMAPFMIETSVESLRRLSFVKKHLDSYDAVLKLFLVGRQAKFPTASNKRKVREHASKSLKPSWGKVVIVAGSTQQNMKEYKQLLLKGFENFKGTVISGGTTAGISGLIGDLSKTLPDSVRTVGYVPKLKKVQSLLDHRYDEIYHSSGNDFGILEPLQYWADLLCSGVHPEEVKLLGIGGGRISAIEYRLALAFGAQVAILDQSGREADKIFQDEMWNRSENLLRLPVDSEALKHFIR